MKKNILVIQAFAILGIAACGRVNNPQENTQGKIDSMVNAKVDSIITRLRVQNDSIINAKANAKAQEIISAKGK